MGIVKTGSIWPLRYFKAGLCIPWLSRCCQSAIPSVLCCQGTLGDVVSLQLWFCKPKNILVLLIKCLVSFSHSVTLSQVGFAVGFLQQVHIKSAPISADLARKIICSKIHYGFLCADFYMWTRCWKSTADPTHMSIPLKYIWILLYRFILFMSILCLQIGYKGRRG